MVWSTNFELFNAMESTIMMSLNQAAQTLQIGKPRLYRLISENDINPTPDGNRKILTDEQIKQLKKSLARSKKTLVQPQFPGLKNQKVRTVSKNRSAKISQSVRELLNAKDSQIEHLQKLLESERARLAEVREDKENRQAIPMDIQKVFRQLSQVSEVLKNFLKNSVEQLDQKGVFEKFSRILDRK